MAKPALLSIGLFVLLATGAGAQTYGNRLDLYFGDWHRAPAHTAYGKLIEQDLLTTGDPLDPKSPGAVLHFATALRHATIAAHATTDPIHLSTTQQILFVESGEGTATAGSQTIHLVRNIALLVPAGLTFTLANTGGEPLALYLIEEPVPPGFHANAALLVRDENAVPFSTTDLDWSYMVKPLFTSADGLATLTSVSTVSLDPLTIGRPRLTPSADVEQVWTALSGPGLNFVSNAVRRQPPGTAFLGIPDGETPHSIVDGDPTSGVRLLYFAREPAASDAARSPANSTTTPSTH